MVDDDSESNPVGTLEGMEIIHDEEGERAKTIIRSKAVKRPAMTGTSH
ncbi:hypothetical protein ACFQMM_15035 [Saliphagus sp. GCM10025308]